MNMEQMVKELSAILKGTKAEVKGYDTSAEVVRIEEDTAWVHIPGGIDETPVKLTINANEGDTVQIRISGGRAWLTGNVSNPPTDDTVARVANKTATEARETATEAQVTAADAEETASTASASATRAIGMAEDNAENIATYQSDISQLRGQLENELLEINTALTDNETAIDETKQAFETLNKYVWLDGKEIVISDKTSGLNDGFVNRITAEGMFFFYNGTLKAYVDAEGFHFAKGELEEELRIGNYLLSSNSRRFDVIYAPIDTEG